MSIMASLYHDIHAISWTVSNLSWENWNELLEQKERGLQQSYIMVMLAQLSVMGFLKWGFQISWNCLVFSTFTFSRAQLMNVAQCWTNAQQSSWGSLATMNNFLRHINWGTKIAPQINLQLREKIVIFWQPENSIFLWKWLCSIFISASVLHYHPVPYTA